MSTSQWLCFWVCALGLLTSCASPTLQFITVAGQYGFTSELHQGQLYMQRLFLNSFAQNRNFYDELHVYLDGDGTPWETMNSPAEDPTARSPIIIELISKDKKPAILLGRPCYYGMQNTKNCQPSVWTSHRYSRDVVANLVFVLQQFLKRKSANRLVFVGYSGGGALVTLMAGLFPQTSAIITISANLDTQAWCEYHNYQPLTESLNPIEAAELPLNIKQIHLAGTQDKNVPSEIIQSFSKRYNGRFISINEYTHDCCWTEMWSSFLEDTFPTQLAQ